MAEESKWEAEVVVHYPRAKTRGRAAFSTLLAMVAGYRVTSATRGAAAFSAVVAFVSRASTRFAGAAASSMALTMAASLARWLGGKSGLSTAMSLSSSSAVRPITYGHIMISGQSNGVGAAGRPDVLSLSQPGLNRMFSSGVHAWPDEDGGLSSVIPLVARPANVLHIEKGESIANGMADVLQQNSSMVCIVSNNSAGGMPYHAIKKGTSIYNRGLTHVTAANSLMPAIGPYEHVYAVCLIHGETDQSDSFSGYAAKLLEFYNDLNTDIKAITGQSRDVRLLVSQASLQLAAATPTDPIYCTPLGVVKAYRQDPSKVVMVGPTYRYMLYDGVHFSPHSQRAIGAMFARVVKRVVKDNAIWIPLLPLSIARTGAVIDVTFNVPTGPLVLDERRILNPGMDGTPQPFGFYFTDVGMTASIVGVAIVGPAIVRITLSGTPTGANKGLAYAWLDQSGGMKGPFAAPRGCLRDSNNEPNAYGYDTFNWCCAFYDPVP